MRMRSRSEITLALGLLVASASTADELRSIPKGGSRNILEWTSTSGDLKARSLNIFKLWPDASSSQYFTITPSGQRLIFVNENRARKGTILVRLSDDQTGWWVEIEEDFQYTTGDLHKFFYTILEREPSADAVIRHTVRTSGGFIFTAATPFIDPQRSMELFVDQLKADGKLEELAAQVPMSVHEGLSFWASILSPASDLDQGKDSGLIIRLLSSTLRVAKVPFRDPYKQTRWKGRVVWEKVGASGETAEAMEFLREFKTSPNGEPREAQVERR